MMNIERKLSEREARGTPRIVQTLSPGLAGRQRAERFVKRCFQQHYGAEINQFMPQLMSLNDQHNELLAVLGICHADRHPLFLENYLKRPAEQVLASKISMPIDRLSLVEVGNLAVSRAGGGRWLITALTAYLSAAGAEWALFTIGPVLINTFRRLGLDLIELGEARRESLPLEERARWGSYYEQKPKVMAGNIYHGHRVMHSLCQEERRMKELWLRAEHAGRQVA
jgi:hypothetical protein